MIDLFDESVLRTMEAVTRGVVPQELIDRAARHKVQAQWKLVQGPDNFILCCYVDLWLTDRPWTVPNRQLVTTNWSCDPREKWLAGLGSDSLEERMECLLTMEQRAEWAVHDLQTLLERMDAQDQSETSQADAGSGATEKGSD